MPPDFQFSSWFELTEQHLAAQAPEEPAALQIKRADGLVDYDNGKSAMVGYFFARENARQALADRFTDELETPGARGFGPLLFRHLVTDDADDILADLLFKFVKNFGEPPILNRYED